MKPRLDEITPLEATARVALRLVQRTTRHYASIDRPPAHYVQHTLCNLPPDGCAMVRFALHSLAVALDEGDSSKQWLEGVCERARFGHSFRRVFFALYKQNRNPYPRVTNRGVQTSARRQQRLSKAGSGND